MTPPSSGLSPEQQQFRDFCLGANDRSQPVRVHFEPLTVDEKEGIKLGGLFLVQQENRFGVKKAVVFLNEAGLEELFASYLLARHGKMAVADPRVVGVSPGVGTGTD